jgi:hypothetical protein
MFKTKFLATILIVLTVLFGQVGGVLAAPATQDVTPPTIQSVTTETVAGVTTVIVTVVDGTGATQTYPLSLEAAAALGLVSVDSTTNVVTVDETKFGQVVTVENGTITGVVANEQPDEEPFNPVAGLIASFFGVDNATINGYHEDGFGFGLIAQALWMSKNLTEDGAGDPEIAGCILDAKQNGTYSECFNFGDEDVPTNWGQFKKQVLDNKEKHNLGVIVSGHADDTTEDAATHPGNGNNKEKNKDKNKEKGNNGNGNGNGKP